jgi:hypothetical protein
MSGKNLKSFSFEDLPTLLALTFRLYFSAYKAKQGLENNYL